MKTLNMDRIYDYMFHLINEYSKLLDFKPTAPSSATEVCSGSVMCLADDKSKQFFERSRASPATTPPCELQPEDENIINNWKEQKQKAMADVEAMKAPPAQTEPAG